jgi:transcriptional regulator with XRE-family HTH domain
MNTQSDQLGYITRQQLAARLGVTYQTLWRWLKEKELTLPQRRLSPADQQHILVVLGVFSDTSKPNNQAKPPSNMLI